MALSLQANTVAVSAQLSSTVAEAKAVSARATFGAQRSALKAFDGLRVSSNAASTAFLSNAGILAADVNAAAQPARVGRLSVIAGANSKPIQGRKLRVAGEGQERRGYLYRNSCTREYLRIGHMFYILAWCCCSYWWWSCWWLRS